MPYELLALIAPLDLIKLAAAEVPTARVAPLRQGFGLIPATVPFLSAVQLGGGEQVFRGEHGFDWFPAGLERRLVAWSKAGPIACVEADYFGGTGTQRAAVWSDGRLVLGPLTVGELERFPPEGSPISQALRRIGARADEGHDEFDAVGLGAHGRTERWAATG
ncbi:hypothetical protein ACWEQL_36700 [Kitasatospora sp. NPDC004240]